MDTSSTVLAVVLSWPLLASLVAPCSSSVPSTAPYVGYSPTTSLLCHHLITGDLLYSVPLHSSHLYPLSLLPKTPTSTAPSLPRHQACPCLNLTRCTSTHLILSLPHFISPHLASCHPPHPPASPLQGLPAPEPVHRGGGGGGGVGARGGRGGAGHPPHHGAPPGAPPAEEPGGQGKHRGAALSFQ